MEDKELIEKVKRIRELVKISNERMWDTNELNEIRKLKKEIFENGI